MIKVYGLNEINSDKVSPEMKAFVQDDELFLRILLKANIAGQQGRKLKSVVLSRHPMMNDGIVRIHEIKLVFED